MPARSHRCLSRGAEQLEVLLHERQQRAHEAGGDDFDCDVLIVGSGYGGAIAAAHLAGSTERGQGGRPARIWLVERGAEHLPGRFPSRLSELPGHVRFATQDGGPPRGRDEGLLDLRLGPDVCVLLGNGLGGGSLINAGVLAEPEPAVFANGHWPPAITAAAMRAPFDAVRAALGTQRLPAARRPRKRVVFDAMSMRMRSQPADDCDLTINLEPGTPHDCTLCGDCLTGCNQGAKGSLDTTGLARARRGGVEIFCGVAVERIEPAAPGSGAPWRVRWRYTDRQLRRTQVEAGAICARRVVLAAGALGSTEILLRSRAALGLPEGRIGQRFSTNGDALMAGAGHLARVGIVADPESDPADPLARGVGPTITGMVKVPAAGGAPAFVVQEFAVPAALRQLLGEVTVSRWLFQDKTPDPGLPLLADPHAVHDDAVARTSLFGVMGHDDAAGVVQLPPQPAGEAAIEGGVRIDWQGSRPLALYRAARDWLTAASGAAVLASDRLLFGFAPMVTVHPLGGCAMAASGAAGVVNARGQVFKGEGEEAHETLVVLDGAIVPCSLGINPALTIAALAERALPGLLDCWRLDPVAAATAAPARPLPPRPVSRRQELPPAEVTWRVRERLHGLCELDGTTGWARLELEFDPVPGFAKALQLNHRVVKVRRAELFLAEVPPGTDEFSVPDQLFAPGRAARVSLTGSVELFAPGRWPDERPLPDMPGAPEPAADPDAPARPATRLVYRLAVQGTGAGLPSAWRVGARLVGVKTVLDKRSDPPRSPWRELSEAEMSLDGMPLGRWALDQADLAERREALLALLALTTMPDALADLGAVAMYVVRRLGERLFDGGGGGVSTDLAQIAQRWPGPLKAEGRKPRVIDGPGWPAAWRLSHYAGRGAPVVLIHGLGASGANFTHPMIPGNLARALHEGGRDVWVLDVRSSIANEGWRRLPEAAEASVESVALADIPPAIARVCEETGQAQVDVIAHCMGAVMFTLAALGSETLAPRVRAAVLSQVGPLVRLSPMNRLRGWVGSYLQTFLQLGELDATPDVRVGDNGEPEPVKRGPLAVLLDALLGTFPYADDDGDADIEPEGTAFRDIRHRADAIFGQLFERRNMAPEALAHLAALFGWVKLPMLAQAIHFARQEMLTDARGRNAFLSRDRLQSRFAFPVLIVHGQRNRVFDWRGSLASLELLRRTRGGEGELPAPVTDLDGRRHHYAAGESAQLVVLTNYGHLDCLLGRAAADEVFPVASRFLAEADALRSATDAARAAAATRRDPEPPWFGPMLGTLADERDSGESAGRSGRGQRRLAVSVLLHPSLRRRQTHGIVVVPVRRTVAGVVPAWRWAAWKRWPGRDARLPEKRPGERRTRDADVREAAVRLSVDPARLRTLGDTFALVTLHHGLDLPPPSQGVDARRRHGADWLDDGEPLSGELETQVKAWVNAAIERGELERTLFSLPDKARRAADKGRAAARPPALTFALASCQYPPGLLDEGPAQASLARLAADADAADGPQFLLLAGDQVYADATAGVFDPAASALAGPLHRAARFDRIYEQTWGLPAFRRLVSRLPVYPMLDDHEVHDGWQGLDEPGSAGAAAERAEAMHAFDRFQEVLIPDRAFFHPPHARAAGGEAAGGADRSPGTQGSKSYRLHPAGVPLFVIDTRTRRSWRTADGVEGASLLAETDLDTLIEGLTAAPAAAVKLVLTPVPLLPPERVLLDPPPERLRSDTWSGFPATAARLLAAIRDRRIGRVVLLAGDSHLSCVTSFAFDRPNAKPGQRARNGGEGSGGQRIVSVVSSGLYTPWPFANTRPDELILDGEVTFGAGEHAASGRLTRHAVAAASGYAIVQVQPEGGGAVTLRVSLRGGDGTTVACAVDLGAPSRRR